MVGETSNGKLIYSQDDSIVKKTVQIKDLSGAGLRGIDTDTDGNMQ